MCVTAFSVRCCLGNDDAIMCAACCSRQTCIQSVRSASTSLFLKKFSKNLTIMCKPAFNCDFPVITRPPSWFPRNPHVCIPLRLMAHLPTPHKFTSQYLFNWLRYGSPNVFFYLQCLISRSFKVKGQGRIQLPAYGFLIVPHTNYGSIYYRLATIHLRNRQTDVRTTSCAVTVTLSFNGCWTYTLRYSSATGINIHWPLV